MDTAESNDYYMRIDYAREAVLDVQQQLQDSRNDIAKVMDAAELLTAEACALALRREELEKDEATLVQSEAIAVQNKILAEKKLMDIGGYECVVRILRKDLQKAKLEIMDTEDETKDLIHEELLLRAQIASMTESLTATQQSVAKLQHECASAAEGKRQTDDKLRQLSLFLDQALNSPSSVRHHIGKAPGHAYLSVSLYATAMDKYRRVEKPRREEQSTQVEPNEIRITQQGKVRSYISYANGLFAEKSERRVVLKAMGNAISKAVTVAEILKHRVANLHQVTRISSIETVDVYEPLEEGLDRIETTRHIPGISIQLSLDELERDDPGYQSPIPLDQVTAGSPTYHDGREFRKPRGHSRRSGRNGNNSGDAETAAKTEETIEEVEVEADEQSPGEGATGSNTGTPTTRGKRGKGRGRGRSGSNGGRGKKTRGRNSDGEDQAEAGAVEQVETGTPATQTNRKSGRGRKGKRTPRNDDEKTAEGEDVDESRENGGGGKGRHSARGRGRGRARGGRGGSNGRDGNAASATTDAVAATEQ
ncbi:aspartyl protease family A01B, putative [Phytophthora infestans T30-4]|uniref:Aspartyl protease family A01B, putative n=2 Tax=Phytophthora infestans TaxID=4787 RepID=D0MQP4_PHYIT|nr:aspartyl protease family A01B, putative [Phytophthora infestans T30-4]EEY57813.1 aspartyl protease family A01B, putative [Phytophthora infestans T30-4]|eukprot:XP_002908999.1 aspartyl protease family A01B, putative [Phytophthora infestans T30-4]